MAQLDVSDTAWAGNIATLRSRVIRLPATARHCSAPQPRLFTMRDRMLVGEYRPRAHEAGFTRLNFERSCVIDASQTREFLLIYTADSAWARYGVSVGRKGYKMWETARGGTVGVFSSLQAALDTLLTV